MIPIIKGTPPEKLVVLKQKAQKRGLTPEAAFKTLRNPLKETVRKQLVHEQGGLCAYCMCRIPRQDADPNIAPIIIEHFVARNPSDRRDVEQGLDYGNFLAVCHGNRGPHGSRTLSDLTCDAHRENREFQKTNPMDPTTLSSIFYYTDGRIDASDEDVRFDLIQILNLNCPSAPLLSERKSVLDALLQDLGEVPDEDLGTYCKNLLSEFLAETTVKTPYVGILIWYLQNLIDALD